jgi:hypothetical protein
MFVLLRRASSISSSYSRSEQEIRRVGGISFLRILLLS